jgi:mannose-6-phosphate isomerase-like protein (cupin superfamily)
VSKTRSDTHETFSPQQDVRPGNRYLTEMTDGDGDYCVMLCTLPRGVVVPMHSHADRETFYVVSGNPDVFRGDRWEMLKPGDVIDAQDGIRRRRLHAFASPRCGWPVSFVMSRSTRLPIRWRMPNVSVGLLRSTGTGSQVRNRMPPLGWTSIGAVMSNWLRDLEPREVQIRSRAGCF